jgi:hypothetical protein
MAYIPALSPPGPPPTITTSYKSAPDINSLPSKT